MPTRIDPPLDPMDPIEKEPEDKYQRRYSEHQLRKAVVLGDIMRERHSNRRFSGEDVQDASINALLRAAALAPSSCNRQAIGIHVVKGRDQKALLGGLLVGGVGWIHRAPVILLLFADYKAYKAGDEVKWMPYLDAGVMVQQLMLAAEGLGLHSAYANPNVRPHNKMHFKRNFYMQEPVTVEGEQSDIFCGAVAVGHPHPENIPDKKK